MKPVISVEHLSKQYDLGVISSGTLNRDLTRWWAKFRGKPDPYSRIGQKDAFELIGESILALDDVNFTVNQGEALGIIGRNGAGKSTLLKILSRVTAPSSGLIKVKGRIGSLLEVGTGFHSELTGRENVYLNGSILGMRKEEVSKKFDEIVEFSGVEKFIDTPVKRYSSGMYVRLAFAVAAHLDPEILIVDEVLAVGDAEFQKKCLGKMGDVAGEGRTVLFVSHNMSSIQSLCQRVIWMKNGQLEEDGESDEVINHYLKSIASQEEVDSDKYDTNHFKVEQVQTFTKDEKKVEFLHSGEPFSYVIDFSSDGKILTDEINFEIRCYEAFRNTLLFFHSMKYVQFSTSSKYLPKSGKASVNLEGLPLKPGSYRFDVIVKEDNNVIGERLNGNIIEFYEPLNNRININISHYPVLMLVEGAWEIEEK